MQQTWEVVMVQLVGEFVSQKVRTKSNQRLFCSLMLLACAYWNIEQVLQGEEEHGGTREQGQGLEGAGGTRQ